MRSAAIPSLEGVVVIDVVEGTAISSLPFMESVLRGRPLRFETLRQAADWALATGGWWCSGAPSIRVTRGLLATLLMVGLHAISVARKVQWAA